MTSAAVVFGAQRIVNAGILVGLVVCSAVLPEPLGRFPLSLRSYRFIAALRCDGRAAHWRGGYAGGDFAA